MFTQAYLPDLYSSLGTFITLIVVNCIILGRAEAFASKNGPVASFFDGLGSGIGFTLAICVIAIIREVCGTGALSFGVYFPVGSQYIFHLYPERFALSIFIQSAGGFITLGGVLAFLAWRKNVKEDKKLQAEKARIEELMAKKAAELKAKAEAEAKAKAEAEAKPEVKEETKVEAKEEPKAEEKPAEEAKPDAKQELNKEVA